MVVFSNAISFNVITGPVIILDRDGYLEGHSIELNIFYRFVNKNKFLFIDRIVLVSNPSSIVILTQ